MKKRSGFTLLELLIVIAIIAILAGIIYVAVDPARRLAEAQNAERWSSVNSILNAVLRYTVDQKGTFPAALTAVSTGTYVIGAGGTCAACTATTTPSDCMNLSTSLVPDYIADMPYDSQSGSADDTRYWVYRSSSGRIAVGACEPESIAGTAPVIKVSR